MYFTRTWTAENRHLKNSYCSILPGNKYHRDVAATSNLFYMGLGLYFIKCNFGTFVLSDLTFSGEADT